MLGEGSSTIGRMPINLDSRSIDRFAHLPIYRQLADILRAAITERELKPNEALPSEGEMAAAVGISRTAVRESLDVLANEGLIVRRSGTATRVAEPPPLRRMDTARYLKELELLIKDGPHPETSAFTEEHDADWSEYSMDVEYRKETATQADIDYLQVKPRTAILRRRFIKYVKGVPIQIQRSAIPHKLAAGTLLADPNQQPWPGGTIAELYSVGLVVTKVTEDASARMPTDEERRQLQMNVSGPVWDIVRTFFAAGKPVEASRVIAPAARNILHYETDLSLTA